MVLTITESFYLLDADHNVVKATLDEWSKMFDDAESRQVDFTKLPNGFDVSTVFLGMNHNFYEGEPLLFESMVFAKGSHDDLDQRRYTTWNEAVAGHKEMVELWANKSMADIIDEED